MSRIIWIPSAKEDLARIKAYIRRDSKVNATRFIKRIRNAVAGMKRFPEAGSLVPDFEPVGFREIFVGSYRVIYRVVNNEIQICSVIHGARSLPDSLGRI